MSLFGLTTVHSLARRRGFDLPVRRYEVEIKGLPRGLDRFRVVQLSDLHLGPCVSPEFVSAVVERSLELAPDLIVMTGDYVEHARSPVGALSGLLGPLRAESGGARVPPLAVLGNHDWYAGAERVRGALVESGTRLVENSRLFLSEDRELMAAAPRIGGLCIAGLGDLGHGDTDPGAALSGLSAEMPRIVLAHNPDSAELGVWGGEAPLRVDLMLAGHTHGGQVRLPLIGSPVTHSRYGQKYLGGVVQGPRFPVVVSRGLGMSLLPVRFRVPPELVEVTLRRG